MHDQATGFDLDFACAFRSKKFLQSIAAVRGITQPESLLRGRRQVSVTQIGAGFGAVGRLKPLLEECRGQLHHVMERGTFLLAPFLLLVARWHRHARHIGDLLHRFGKAHSVEFSQKPEMVARNTAAEAVIATLSILAVEAGRLLAVERATGPIVSARGIRLPPVPRNTAADDGRNRHAVTYLVEEASRKAHHS